MFPPVVLTLKEARVDRGWTQQTLAAKSGVRQQVISRIERGDLRHPAHVVVMRICRALTLPPSAITEFADGGSL